MNNWKGCQESREAVSSGYKQALGSLGQLRPHKGRKAGRQWGSLTLSLILFHHVSGSYHSCICFDFPKMTPQPHVCRALWWGYQFLLHLSPWGEDSENRYKSLLRVPDHLVLHNVLSFLLPGGLTCRVLGSGMVCDEQAYWECLAWFYSWLKWS